METPSEKSESPEKKEPEENTVLENKADPQENQTPASSSGSVCEECGRALSQKTGICYYCNREVDKETEKNLSMLLLDWQQEAAADPEARETEKLRKVLSVIMAIAASACITMGIVPDIDKFNPAYVHWSMGVLIAACCWCFYFNSMTALLTVAANTAGLIFYILLIIKAIPERMVATAFLSGLIVGLCGFALFLITNRIFKTKTVEL